MRIVHTGFRAATVPNRPTDSYLPTTIGTFPVRSEGNKKMSIIKLFRRVQAWRQEERLISELSALSDHELNDIGVDRGQIALIVRKS